MRVQLKWIDSEVFESEDTIHHLNGVNGILVPGGFGERGVEGKIAAQLSLVNMKFLTLVFAWACRWRLLSPLEIWLILKVQGSTEFGPCNEPLVGLLTEWRRGGIIEKRTENGDMGGTMRLGGYDAILQKGSKVHHIYEADEN